MPLLPGIPHLRKEFWGDADIPGDLVLGNALRDLWVFVEELKIALPGCLRDDSSSLS